MIYKEWIKLKWFLIMYALFAVLVIGYIFLKVRHDMFFTEPKSYWYGILFQGYQYFKFLKYIPLIGGIMIAVAQYFPETVNKRIKLTFHLPREENSMLLTMMGFGTVCLLSCYLLAFLFFWFFSSLYFPAEIIAAAVISILPWFMAGLAAYFWVALVLLEPLWLFRLLYFTAACGFIPLLLKQGVAGSYAPVVLIFAGFVALLSISLLFSGYRFRKGEM